MLKSILDRLESYSWRKRVLVLFFIATWDAWVMPIMTILLVVSGLSEVSFFQADPYASFLWNGPNEKFYAKLITEPLHYYMYIYLLIGEIDALYIQGFGNLIIDLNIFHVFSFILFVILLLRKSATTGRKLFYGMMGVVVYYVIGSFTVWMYLFTTVVLNMLFPDVF